MKLPIEGIPLLPPDVVAPEKQRLRFVTDTKLYSIPTEAHPAEGDFEGLFLRECHVPKPQPKLPKNIGEYTITIEAEIETSGGLNESSQRIRALAHDLDKFWVYACGEPLLPIVTQISFDVTLRGWQSNFEAVKSYLLANCKKPFAIVQMNQQHWIDMPYYPLRPALEARDRYLKADASIQALADLHCGALKLPLSDGGFFAFARGLELARTLLSGKDDAAKEMSLALPAGTLKKSLPWLFNVGNNRFNTRHVVRDKSASPVLHDRMTGQEIMDYKHDADLVLRVLVCQKLGIQMPNLWPASEMNQPPAAS